MMVRRAFVGEFEARDAAEGYPHVLTLAAIHPSSLIEPDDAKQLAYPIVPFAQNGFDEPVFLKPGADEPDVVWIARGSQFEQVEKLADSLDALI